MRIRFTKVCLDKKIVPQHLKYLLDYKFHFFHFKSRHKMNYFSNQFIVRTLKLNDAYRSVKHSKKQILILKKKIQRHVPLHNSSSFFI